MNKQAVWTLMTVGACLIGLYALASALVPSARGDFVLNMIDTNATGALAHFLGGAVVIIVGALQFHAGLRKNRPALHRCLGRVYVIGVLIGGLAGLYLAFYSSGGLVAHWGFGSLAVCWLTATGLAYQKIRAGQFRLHQDWMIRSYALTLGALTLRLYLPMAQLAGITFDDAYPAIAWLSWVPNLIIAEWWLIPRSNRKVAAL